MMAISQSGHRFWDYGNNTALKIILTSSSDLSLTKEELRKAQDLMTKAFVQFHKNLRVLKSYW